MCPHTPMCVIILLMAVRDMRPHTAICVLILLYVSSYSYVCHHTADGGPRHVSATALYNTTCPHTTTCVLMRQDPKASTSIILCVRMLLQVSSYDYMCASCETGPKCLDPAADGGARHVSAQPAPAVVQLRARPPPQPLPPPPAAAGVCSNVISCCRCV
jgi:hypothetical protein